MKTHSVNCALLKKLNGSGPEYINEMLMEYRPSRTLSSVKTGQVVEPRVETKHDEVVLEEAG